MDRPARCKYCRILFMTQLEAVRHVAEIHPRRKISILLVNVDKKLKPRTYDVKGEDIGSDRNRLLVDRNTGKIHVRTTDPIDSPVHKMKKVNTPTKSVHKQLFPASTPVKSSTVIYDDTENNNSPDNSDSDEVEELEETILYSDCNNDSTENMSTNASSDDNDTDLPVTVEAEKLKTIVEKLQELLPAVTKNFEDKNRLREWVSFFTLVASGNFNTDHIASQLFWDVIKFYTTPNIFGMRFTPEVKQFWSIGLSLFHSKSIQFMGGYKGLGLITAGKDRSELSASESNVNFVCPKIDVLREEIKKCNINCEKPGIIHSNIEAISNTDDAKMKSYKVCIDGKKITSGYGNKFGEVDLFGHESQPTLQEKRERLEVEKLVITETQSMLEKCTEMQKDDIQTMSSDERDELKSSVVNIISVLTERVKELRLLKVKRSRALEKFMVLAGEQWQRSRYSYAISSMRTHLLRINVCVNDALQLVDKLGLVAAFCNGTSNMYSIDKNVNLQKQLNYVCLNEIRIDSIDEIPCDLVKQRSDLWFQIRKTAKATGSSLHKAAGLSTLKEQQKHYNITNGLCKETEIIPSEAMRHGVENELNGIGVLVSKVLPIYEPDSCYYEEGCYRLKDDNGDNIIIVSPDGSCRQIEKPIYAIEVKCPLPGKTFKPDVHYKIPEYYVCQILSEMKALECNVLFYLCWTPQSCTVFRARFNEELWLSVVKEIENVYYSNASGPPKKRSASVQTIKAMLKTYNDEYVQLVGEFPSVISTPCEHKGYTGATETARKYHNADADLCSMSKVLFSRTSQVQESLLKAMDCVNDMYNILRTPGKEVLVAVLSDVDRMSKPGHVHALPIAYGISGYSLEVEVVRSILTEVVNACHASGLIVRALSSDGQFYKLAVRDKNGKPLTVLQVAKDTWSQAKKMSKNEQISMLMSKNRPLNDDDIDCYRHEDSKSDGTAKAYGPLIVPGTKTSPWKTFITPPNIQTLVERKTKQTKKANDTEDLNNLPPDVLNSIVNIFNSNDINDIDSSVQSELQDCTQTNIESSNDTTGDTSNTSDARESVSDTTYDIEKMVEEEEMQISYDILVIKLKEIDSKRKKTKWVHLDEETLKRLLSSSPDVVMKRFTKEELIVCVHNVKGYIGHDFDTGSATKLQLVNAISLVLGNKTTLVPKKSPKKLRALLKEYLSQKVGKDALNAVIATDLFINETLIGNDPKPYVWYSQPEFFPSVEHHMVYLLDCHHLFVNARCFVVQNGISGLNIRKEAWLDVAKTNNTTNVGLSIAMVIDVIDRQSNAIAQLTFSEPVENEMRKLGWEHEADFCRTIRNWYRAEDEPGLDVMKRHEYRMRMRDLLLGSTNLASFPPAGSHILGMPVVMFEGILTNIDRRIQLYELIPNKSYNVRAPNSLDVENLFSEFRDVDPKSSGALLADDIPLAMESACYVMQMRLNPNRKFNMNTSRRVRVYPANVLQEGCLGDHVDVTTLELRNDRRIEMRNHSFDCLERKRKPKRKSATVPSIDEPAKGTKPIREHHRVDSSKILPHVRFGLTNI